MESNMILKLASCILVILLMGTPFTSARIYTDCELAKKLVRKFNVRRSEVANWVCLSKYGSDHDTSARLRQLTSRNYNYGIFQISGRFCIEDDDFDFVDRARGRGRGRRRGRGLGHIFGLGRGRFRPDRQIEDQGVCDVSCTSLLRDNLAEDVVCARQIIRNYGFEAWPTWRRYCRGRDVESLIDRCRI